MPVDDVWTGESFEASKRVGCLPTQKAGVWQSTEMVTFLGADLRADAYQGPAGEEDEVADGEDASTSLLASP